ncbi:hypothetical protein DUI87_01592 [Hirundo rustica rustica]|uniref:Reverse transcriptase domain-containing protein n=1 Tax=Hirundo rustica rustica TaxID=333673 RepID=A0A3M0LCG8_HIRRU|nr:hypothetical protein DUI87_01592 [Hirundo rustica rustica]
MGEPVIHDCLETIEATYSSRPDLKDTPLEDAETWFTDGSSYVISGRRRAGYAVTTSKEVIESGPLTSTWTQDAIQLPERLAIMHIKAHQKVSSELEEGNMLADREAKEAAKGEVPDQAVEAALIPDGKISIEAQGFAEGKKTIKPPESRDKNPREAQKVYVRRDEEKAKLKAKLMAVTTRENDFQKNQKHTGTTYRYEGIETKEDGIECLWVRIKGKANKADILLGVCYRQPNQEEELDNLFYKQLGNVSGSSALVLVGDFNLPDICWELNTAEKRQSRKFLECMEDNFLSQLVGEPTRGGTMLDLLFANRDGLVGDVVVGGRLGQSDHEIIEFSIFGEVRRSTSKTLALDFRRADFGLFRRLQSIPWEAALKNKGVQESWSCFKPEILMAQEQTVPVCQKMGSIERELADELAKPLSIIYQQSWLTGEVPDDWKLANVTPIHRKGGREDPSNYRPVSLTSVPDKIMEQFILSAITQNLQDGQGIRPSQHGFRRGRSCLTNLITFYGQVTHLVDAGKALDIVYLDFSKAFDTVSHSILLDKLAAHGLDRSTLCWVRNWLDGWAQRVVVNSAASSW